MRRVEDKLSLLLLTKIFIRVIFFQETVHVNKWATKYFMPKTFQQFLYMFFFLIKNCHIILVFILIILEFVIPVCPWFSIFNPFYIIFVSLDSPLSLLIFLPPQYQLNIKKSTRQFKKTWEPYWIWTYETKIRGKFQNFIWILGRDSIMSQVVRKDHFTKAIFAD